MEKYLTPGEYAGIYRVSVRTVTRMCERGEVPGAKKVGRQWRIPNPDWKAERDGE